MLIVRQSFVAAALFWFAWGGEPILAQRPPLASDPLRLSVDEVVSRALDPTLGTARARADVEAAEAAFRQAGAIPNLTISALAENLGAQQITSGLDGWPGVQGGVELGLPLSLSGGRRASRGVARAGLDLARSSLADREREVAYRAVEALVAWEQAGARLRTAEAEVRALEVLHENLALGARLGEVSAADAARTLLALGQARVEQARALGALANEHEALLAMLGYPAGTPLELVPPNACPSPGAGSPPEAEAQAQAQAERMAEDIPVPLRSSALARSIAQQEAARARAERWPDVTPRLGWRREAGADALAVGFEWELPLFNRRQGAVDEAVSRVRGSEDAFREAERRWVAERATTLRQLDALAAAGAMFDDAWHAALALTVGAAEATFTAGEGSLEEVLQARRARLASLEDAFAWEAELRRARLALDRSQGLLPAETLFCSPLNQELR
jgi:outer membrane protein, heavy metal efflux system